MVFLFTLLINVVTPEFSVHQNSKLKLFISLLLVYTNRHHCRSERVKQSPIPSRVIARIVSRNNVTPFVCLTGTLRRRAQV